MNRTPFYVHIITALLITPYVILVFYFAFNYNPLLFSNESLKNKLGFSSQSNNVDIVHFSETEKKDDEISVITNTRSSSDRIHTFIRAKWSLKVPKDVTTPWTIHKDQILIAQTNNLSAYDLDKTLLWSLNFDSKNNDDKFLSPVSINNNFIYAATTAGRVYKLDRKSGKLIWRLNLHNTISAPVKYHQNHIYITQTIDEKTTVFKVDAIKGELKWASKKLSPFNLPQTYLHRKNKLFYGITNDSIIALNTEDGSVKWESSTQGQLKVAPLVTRDRIYMANQEGLSLAISSKTGREIWNFAIDAGVVNPITLAGALNRIALITDDNYSHIINTANGKRIWRFKFKNVAEKSGFGVSKVKAKTAAAWSLGSSTGQYVLWAPCKANRLCIKRISNGQSLAHIDIKGEMISSPIFTDNSLFLVHKPNFEGQSVLTKYAFGSSRAKPKE